MSFIHPPKPCKNCPFRREGGVRLRSARIDEIVAVVAPEDGGGGRFPCHKTLPRTGAKQEMECAGALIFAYKLEASSNFMRIMERLGGIDRDLCDGDHPEIFDTVEEMQATALDAPRPRRRRGRR